MKYILTACLFLLTTMTLPSTTAAPPRPARPQFNSLHVAADGTLLAEVISQGTYRSSDGGGSWTSTGVIPNYATLFKGGGLNAERQLCVPRDGGGNWSCIGLHESVNAVLADGTLYKCAADRIASSIDGGKQWSMTAPWSSAGSQVDYCQAIVARGDLIYVLGEALYRSTDRGANWTRVSGETVIEKERILGMMLDRDGTLYASSANTDVRRLSMYASTDGGRHWTRRTFGLPATWEVFSLTRILSSGLVFSAAQKAQPGQPRTLYFSRDGKTAVVLKIDDPDSGFIDVQEGPGNVLFVVTRETIHRSDDGGASWRELGQQGISRP